MKNNVEVTVAAVYQHGDPAAGKVVFTKRRRLRQLPHARRRRHERQRRPGARPGQAGALAGRPAPHARPGRDAELQGPADQEADRGRCRLRRQGVRRQPERLILPEAFPRDVKVVATDFDRTLVWDDGVLRPRTLDTLRRAHEAGLHVVVVTGRMFQSVRRALEPAALGDPVICYQGAVVADGRGHLAAPRADRARPRPRGARVRPGRGVQPQRLRRRRALRRRGERGRARVRGVPAPRRCIPSATCSTGCRSRRRSSSASDDPDALDGVEQRAKAHFGDAHVHLEVAAVLPRVRRTRCDEGAGLDFLAEHMGFTRAETVAFGDGENDVELVEWAGYGIAVANAHDACQGGCRLDRAERAGRRGRTGDRRAARSTLDPMIDLKAARNDPDAARAALARRGAADAFDELLRADEEWRALVPRVDELRRSRSSTASRRRSSWSG